MSRVLQREEKRSNILKAAANVFAREGYYNAKMKEIATVAGIGKGTIYEYFDNKKHLFFCMIEEGADSFINTLFQRVEEEEDFKNIFKSILESSFEFMEQHEDITRLIINHPGMVDEKMQKWLAKKKNDIIVFFMEIIEKHADENNYKVVNPILASHSLFGIIISLLGEYLFHDNSLIDVEKIAKDAAGLFYHGIKNWD